MLRPTFIILLLLLQIVSRPAEAQILPNSTVESYVDYPTGSGISSNEIDTYGTISDGGVGWADSATVNPGIDPTLTASWSGLGGRYLPGAGGVDNFGAGASLIYDFEVEGGASGVSIPIDVVADLFCTGGAGLPSVDTSATMLVYPLNGYGHNILQASTSTSDAINQEINFTSGQVYTVALYANVATANFPAQGNSETATVDPTFTIDPSFTTSGYTVALSPDVVPDPSTWALVIVGGFGLLTLCWTRQRA